VTNRPTERGVQLLGCLGRELKVRSEDNTSTGQSFWSGSAECAIFLLQDTPSSSQSPPPGFGEKRLPLSGLPFHSSASGGGSRFTVMFGHT
jgi:hypothetical protein